MFEPFGRYLIGILDFIFIAFVVYILAKKINETKFAATIREFLLTLVFVTVIVNITGSFLTQISGATGSGTRIYGVYPAIITTVGGVGSIIGSTATTKLALGLVKPFISSIKEHLNEIAGAWLASIVLFTVYGVVSSVMSGAETLGAMAPFIGQLLTTNFLAVSLMVFIAYAVAIFTFRRGWNPDNFVIPIESSLADTITTAAILVALTLIVI
jgi:mgtE-like transporter